MLKRQEILNVMQSKNEDELFEKVKTIFGSIGIDVYNEDGSVKDLYTVLCEVAEVWNKEKQV